MVNASGHIEQQLSKLQQKTADIATELETLVDGYLKVLSQASKRQLVLAAYQICTQVYPDNFLALSLSQRNALQKKLRELGDLIQPQLRDKWSTAKRLSRQPAEDDGLAVIRQLFLEAASATEQLDPDSPDPGHGQQDEQPGRSEESSAAKRSQQKLLAEMQTLIGSERLDISREHLDMELPEPDESSPMQPAQLMRRQILIEKGIRDVLKTVSEHANEILQKANVVPEIPKALLAAAADSEHLGQIPMKTPNLVRLAIKIMHEPAQERHDKDDDPSDLEADDEGGLEQWPDEAEISAAIITGEETSETEHESDNGSGGAVFIPKFLKLDALPDFVMIHLRLSEIEFAETNVAVWRSRIRKKMGHLKQVGHAYKEAERQLAIAQAEDAWRASWTND